MSKTYKELIKDRAQLDDAIKTALVNEKPAAIASVLELIKDFGLTAEECGFKVAAPKKKASKAVDKPDGRTAPKPAKYRNPNNPNETWTGLGAKNKKPVWVQEYLAAGGKIEDCLINPK
ncbi:H-NS family nucleoid-associated regulatory protein [Dechloromonas sp. ARDL1]|uniref:H-NS histone family protein n=1 Tax=Dechloromonas sp. ARDL1 TaxID=3322121 RepID=UPI003DA719BA